MSHRAILVFARRPELGRVKTRLDDYLGKTLTLSLYCAFLTDTLFAAKQTGATVVLAHTAGGSFPEQALADITLIQRGSSFGERFDSSLADAAKRLPIESSLILIGTDTPHLPPSNLRKAFNVLEECDAVIGPNENGGFYLLGFSTTPVPVAEVFTHAADEEPRELTRLLERADLRTSLLEPEFDVDLPDDLVRLNRVIDDLESTGADWVPENTRNILRSEPLISAANHNTKRLANKT